MVKSAKFQSDSSGVAVVEIWYCISLHWSGIPLKLSDVSLRSYVTTEMQEKYYYWVSSYIPSIRTSMIVIFLYLSYLSSNIVSNNILLYLSSALDIHCFNNSPNCLTFRDLARMLICGGVIGQLVESHVRGHVRVSDLSVAQSCEC